MNKLLPILILPILISNAVANAGPGPWADGAYYPGQLDGRYFANAYNNTDGSFSRTTNTFFVTNTVSTTVTTGGLPTTVITSTVTGPFSQVSVSGSVVSGLISFGIKDGSPTVLAPGTAAGGSTNASSRTELLSLGFDRSHNYFLMYVNGDVFVGTTAANINDSTEKVSGVLVNGVGRETISRATNTGTSLVGPGGATTVAFSIPTATANGYFNAKVKNNKSPYTFKGDGTVTLAAADGQPSTIDGEHDFDISGIKTSGNSASGFPTTTGTSTTGQ